MLILRRIAFGILGIFLGLLGLLLLLIGLINFVNWDKHHDLVSSTIERYSDWEVISMGSLDILLWNEAHLAVEGLKLRQTSQTSAIESFAAAHIEVNTRVWPLLFRDRLVVENFTYTDGEVILRKALEKAKDQQKSLAEILRALQEVFIRSATIKNIGIIYRDTMQGQELQGYIEQIGVSSKGNDQPVKILGSGAVAKLPFQLQGEMGSLASFLNFDADYPLHLSTTIADQFLDLSGIIAVADQDFRFDIAVKGENISQVWQAFQLDLGLGDIPPYKFRASIARAPKGVSFRGIEATLGSSHVYGDAELQLERERPYVQANLGASLLRYKDIAPLIPKDPEDQAEPDQGPVFSREPIATDALRKFDAHVRFAMAEYKGGELGRLLDGATVSLKLDRGLLTIDPLEIAIARGTVGGQVTLNAREDPLRLAVKFGMKQVHLTSLLTAFMMEVPLLEQKPSEIIMGTLAGNVDLQTSGRSLHQLASHLNGKLQLAVEEGRVSATVIEVFGFDLTETIAAFFGGKPSTELRCMIASFKANSGVIGTDVMLLATADSNIIGEGTVNLNEEKIDYTFETRPRDFSIGAARSPIHIEGPLHDIDVRVDKKGLILRSVAAAVLGTLVNPLLAVLPFIEPGLEKGGQCSNLVGELTSIEKQGQKKLN